MAKTEEQYRDDYLKKSYGITLVDYNRMFEEQGRVCGICKEPQKEGAKRFAVDHCHKWPYFRLDSKKEQDGNWTSVLSKNQDKDLFCAPIYYHKTSICTGRTKSLAIKALRAQLKTLSVRGLLCFKCNTLLRKLYDNAMIAENAGIYLRKHQNG